MIDIYNFLQLWKCVTLLRDFINIFFIILSSPKQNIVVSTVKLKEDLTSSLEQKTIVWYLMENMNVEIRVLWNVIPFLANFKITFRQPFIGKKKEVYLMRNFLSSIKLFRERITYRVTFESKATFHSSCAPDERRYDFSKLYLFVCETTWNMLNLGLWEH